MSLLPLVYSSSPQCLPASTLSRCEDLISLSLLDDLVQAPTPSLFFFFLQCPFLLQSRTPALPLPLLGCTFDLCASSRAPRRALFTLQSACSHSVFIRVSQLPHVHLLRLYFCILLPFTRVYLCVCILSSKHRTTLAFYLVLPLNNISVSHTGVTHTHAH